MSLVGVGLVLLSLVVVLGVWLGFQLVRQNGRFLLRLEALEKQVAQLEMARLADADAMLPLDRPQSLPLGALAPSFELPDLEGKLVSLAQFRGQSVLLIFFSPTCGFCTQMAPALAAVATDGRAGRPLPLVVTTGDAATNRQLVAEYGIHSPVLLQRGMEVASLYQASGTPVGYLIDASGAIASDMALGAAALLQLAGPPSLAPVKPSTAPLMPHENGHQVFRGNRSLDQSRINRDGLPAGTTAPLFRLPRLDGGELALDDYRGQRVLLVFSAPDCGPCNELAPLLERLARRTPDLQVLMVSRGDPAVNRAKVAEYDLTFPVVLQRQWEISRQYAMFATPIAYLIDEQGVIVTDVAAGKEPILALAAQSATRVGEMGRRLDADGARLAPTGMRLG